MHNRKAVKFRLISKLYYKILWSIQQRYLEKHYGDKLPEIDHCWRLHGYVHPDYLKNGAIFDVELLAEWLSGKGLCYRYMIADEFRHNHEFHRVIEAAYNYGASFSIPDDALEDYSQQELELLKALATAGSHDRRVYRMSKDTTHVHYNPKHKDD